MVGDLSATAGEEPMAATAVPLAASALSEGSTLGVGGLGGGHFCDNVITRLSSPVAIINANKWKSHCVHHDRM